MVATNSEAFVSEFLEEIIPLYQKGLVPTGQDFTPISWPVEKDGHILIGDMFQLLWPVGNRSSIQYKFIDLNISQYTELVLRISTPWTS